MNSKMIEYLLEDEIRHAYVIQSLRNKDAHFELKADYGMDLSYAAIWHDDNIVTLYGRAEWCQKWFDHYFGRYDFYDIQPQLLETLCEGSEHVTQSHQNYEKQSHSLMVLKRTLAQCEALKTKKDHSIKAEKPSKGKVRYKYTDQSGRVIGRVLTEKVGLENVLISELVIHDKYRRRGHGAAFVNRLMSQLIKTEKKAQTFVLYVDQVNTPAVKLYEKLGFKEIAVFNNMVLEEDI